MLLSYINKNRTFTSLYKISHLTLCIIFMCLFSLSTVHVLTHTGVTHCKLIISLLSVLIFAQPCSPWKLTNSYFHIISASCFSLPSILTDTHWSGSRTHQTNIWAFDCFIFIAAVVRVFSGTCWCGLWTPEAERGRHAETTKRHGWVVTTP